MKKVNGYLIKSDKESKKALVVLTDSKRCRDCDGGCEACTYAKRYWFVADNSIEAEVGDNVELDQWNFNLTRILLWSFPIVFAAIVFALMLSYGITTSIVMSLASLPAAYLAIYFAVGNKTFFHKKLVITAVKE